MSAREFNLAHPVYDLRIPSGIYEFAEAYALHKEQAWQEWRRQLLDAWANDHRATMTALLEGGPDLEPLRAEPSEKAKEAHTGLEEARKFHVEHAPEMAKPLPENHWLYKWMADFAAQERREALLEAAEERLKLEDEIERAILHINWVSAYLFRQYEAADREMGLRLEMALERLEPLREKAASLTPQEKK